MDVKWTDLAFYAHRRENMFAVGDYVIYGYEGVCHVDDVGCPKVSGLDKSKQYYTLTPHYHGGTIYAPVDGRVLMRPLISRDELDALLPQLPKLPLLDDVPENSRMAGDYYRTILAGHDCTMLLRLCKTLHARQAERAVSRKSVSSTELRNWKTAEEMIQGEFAFVLGIAPSEVGSYLQQKSS